MVRVRGIDVDDYSIVNVDDLASVTVNINNAEK
jgi:hypothetical protein